MNEAGMIVTLICIAGLFLAIAITECKNNS